MKTWQTILLSILFGLLAGGVVWITSSKPRGEPIRLNPAPTSAGLVIQVAGAVKKPGVYTLPPGSRVADALDAAGGGSATANLDSINLAALVQDGQKVAIPALGETIPTTLPAADRAKTISTPAGENSTAGPININTATVEELDSLPGIGASKAAAIIEYRDKFGPFKSTQDLMKVPGIGASILATIQSLITIQD